MTLWKKKEEEGFRRGGSFWEGGRKKQELEMIREKETERRRRKKKQKKEDERRKEKEEEQEESKKGKKRERRKGEEKKKIETPKVNPAIAKQEARSVQREHSASLLFPPQPPSGRVHSRSNPLWGPPRNLGFSHHLAVNWAQPLFVKCG